jgi:Basic region leucine zipper
MMMHTRKRSLEEGSVTPTTTSSILACGLFPSFDDPISTTPTPQIPFIEPSTLRLLTPESTASPPSTPNTSERCSSSPATSFEAERPKKKARTRRNAKTEEEKQARAEERAVRNRRAAQESRDRKKQAFDILEKDNARLRAENQLLKERLASLESRMDLTESDCVVKSEVEEDNRMVETHPAVVMSDQQCQAIRSPLRRPQTLRTTTFSDLKISSLSLSSLITNSSQLKTISNGYSAFLTSPSKQLRRHPQRTTLSTLISLRKVSSSKSRATGDGLNTGSPHFGAEMMTTIQDVMESEFDMSLDAKGGAQVLQVVLSASCLYLGNGLGVNSGYISNGIHDIIMSFCHKVIINPHRIF